MWPFSFNRKSSPVPAVRCGDFTVRWNAQSGEWEFTDGEYDYFVDRPEFDVGILRDISIVKRWLAELDPHIDTEIEKHLEGWCEWTGEKHIVCVDVSRWMETREVDVAFAGGDAWGDLGVNVVITDGAITSSYAGD